MLLVADKGFQIYKIFLFILLITSNDCSGVDVPIPTFPELCYVLVPVVVH